MAARLPICQGGSMAKKDAEREQRLAAALRENLRRRKAQAREGLTGREVLDRHPDESQDP